MKKYIQIKNTLNEVSQDQYFQSTSITFQQYFRDMNKLNRDFSAGVSEWNSQLSKRNGKINKIYSQKKNQTAFIERDSLLKKSLPKIQLNNQSLASQENQYLQNTERRLIPPLKSEHSQIENNQIKNIKSDEKYQEDQKINRKINITLIRLGLSSINKKPRFAFQELKKSIHMKSSVQIEKRQEIKKKIQQSKIKNDSFDKNIIKLKNLNMQVLKSFKKCSSKAQNKISEQKFYKHNNVFIQYAYKIRRNKAKFQSDQSGL